VCNAGRRIAGKRLHDRVNALDRALLICIAFGALVREMVDSPGTVRKFEYAARFRALQDEL